MASDKQPVSQNIVTVLLISPYDEDHQRLEAILRHSRWQQQGAHSQHAALKLLNEGTVPVVICESEMPDGDWKQILSYLGELPCPPLLIVTSRLADDQLWSEVLNLGAYNVLAKPLEKTEVFHVVSLAWLSWKAQLRKRDDRLALTA